jgi:hypothetical protein
MLKLAIAILFLIPNVTLGATIYIDRQLGVNCSSNNYSIANRTCTGKDGNAYNNIQAALTASVANDKIYFRSGSYTVNTASNDIQPKNGQTWAQYPGDAARSATITAAASGRRVFVIYGGFGAQNVTVRDLTVVGGQCWGIHVASTNGAQIINNEVMGWNNQGVDESGCAGIGITAYDTQNANDAIVTDNYIHSPVLLASDNAGIHFGGGAFTPSNVVVARNRIVDVRFGIWMDVHACSPAVGATPCTVEENYVKNVTKHCLHAEIGSTGVWRKNICDTSGQVGFLLRPGASSTVNTQTKVYNNTFYNMGGDNFGVGIWIQNDQATANVTNLEVKNNIIYRASGDSFYGITVGTLTIGQTTNRYQNNLLHLIGTTKGVCWGSPSSDTGGGCGSGQTFDDSASGMSSWAAAAPSGVVSGNIAGDPLFANPAGEDFRLCTGVGTPVASCTGKSPAIDAGANVGLSFQGTAPDLGAVESGASSRGVLLAPTITSVTVTP